jgi:uncharacterized protein YndB with AHSA1/START domain
MASKTGGSIVIDRSVEQVWAWLNDEQHELIWRRPYLKELRRTGPYAVGTRFEGINKGAGKEDRFVDEVTEYQPPERIAWRQVTSVATFPRAGSYTLERQDGHTNFTLEIEIAFTGIARVLERPMSAMATKMLGPTLLKQLKEAIEEQVVEAGVVGRSVAAQTVK